MIVSNDLNSSHESAHPGRITNILGLVRDVMNKIHETLDNQIIGTGLQFSV